MAYLLALAFALACIFASLTTAGWRTLILLIIPIGFIQEPIRKLIPDQPVTVQLMVVVVFALAMVAAIVRFGAPSLTPLAGSSKNTRYLLIFFIVFICAQSLHSLIRFGTPMVPLIGLLGYLLPIPALWVAYVYVRHTTDIRRFLVLYMLAGEVLALSVLVSYRGIESPLFKQVGDAPMVVYHHAVGVVQLYCGFLRSPEVAAWHAAACACVVVVIAVAFKSAVFRLFAPVVVVLNFYIVMLTGRRKALAIMVVFAVVYFVGLIMARRRSSRVAAISTILIAIVLSVGMMIMAPDSDRPNPHLERSATAVGDAWERFESLGLQAIGWGFNEGGVLGLGTGAGAQGTQHISGVMSQGAAEGGLGRIMVELGPIGLVFAILCSVGVARTVRKAVGQASRHNAELAKLELGLVAFIAANVPVFVGAAQIFGDPFVLLILGIFIGFVLAVPRMIHLERRRARLGSDSVDVGLAARVQRVHVSGGR